MLLSYPNPSDKILSDKTQPGGRIYIHGNCVNTGLIPFANDKIKELELPAVQAKNSGQEKIPVHIFPIGLDSKSMKTLSREFQSSPDIIAFWKIYSQFGLTLKNRRRSGM